MTEQMNRQEGHKKVNYFFHSPVCLVYIFIMFSHDFEPSYNGNHLRETFLFVLC